MGSCAKLASNIRNFTFRIAVPRRYFEISQTSDLKALTFITQGTFSCTPLEALFDVLLHGPEQLLVDL